MNLWQLLEETQRAIPPSENITQYFNDAQREIMPHTGRRKMQALSFVNGEATMPTDVLFVVGVSYDGRMLAPIVDYATPSLATGTPTHYIVMLDGRVIISPRPTNATAEIIYCPTPRLLARPTDTPELNAPAALIAYAKYKVYLHYEDQPLAIYWEQEYLKELAKFLEVEGRRFKRSVRVRTRGWM